MKNRFLCAALLGAWCAVGTLSADNNFVRTLNVTPQKDGCVFTVPDTGWVIFEGVGEAALSVEAGGKTLIAVPRQGAVMLRLPQGRAVVKGKVRAVRRIGENIFYQMVGEYDTDAMCRITNTKDATSNRPGLFLYNWKFLNEKIFFPFNVVSMDHQWDPALDRWRSEGRQIVRNISLRSTGAENTAAWEKVAEEACLDGLMIDEFVLPAGRKSATDATLGYTNPGSGFQKDNFEALTAWGQTHPGKRIFPWLGITWEGRGNDAEPLVNALPPDGAVAWEAYVRTRKFDMELEARLYNRARLFKTITGDLSKLRLVLGTYESMDGNYACDFKVALDKMLNIAANHPDFKGLGGAGMWAAHYTDPEILRWYSALVKHYAVDGRKDMLSEQYGYQMNPGFIPNPEWQSLDGWRIEGSADLIALDQTGLEGVFLPKSRTNLLRLVRNPDAENRVMLPLKGLTPGKLYAVETFAVDPASTGSFVDYAFTLRVDGSEELFRQPRRLTDFIRKKQLFNAHKLVFRAGKGPMMLVIGDGGKDASGEKPAILLVDSVRITPYFE